MPGLWTMTDADFADLDIERRSCAGCGRDCRKGRDGTSHSQFGICAGCLADCEKGVRCWICLSRQCHCVRDDGD